MTGRQASIADAVDALERYEQRVRLLMDLWHYLDGLGAPRRGEVASRVPSAKSGRVTVRGDVVRELQGECLVAAGVARRRMDRILGATTALADPDADDESEAFGERELP